MIHIPTYLHLSSQQAILNVINLEAVKGGQSSSATSIGQQQQQNGRSPGGNYLSTYPPTLDYLLPGPYLELVLELTLVPALSLVLFD